MIVTLTLSPCIDKSAAVEQLQPEVKLRCSPMVNEPGGGGINVSKALHELGEDAIAFFPSGGHNGNMLTSLLSRSGIKYQTADCGVETRENWVIRETGSNQQFRFTFPGLPVQEAILEELLAPLPSFSPSFVVASGSLPPGLPDSFYSIVIDHTVAAGAQCVVDTSGAALQALKGKNPFLIKPNAGELCKLLGIDKLEKDDVPAAANQAIDMGYATMIAVSMGAAGAWLVNKQVSFFCAAPVVDRRSTVGAGDSMVAGMVYMLKKGSSLQDTLRFGVACGTAATMNEGTQLFKKEDVWQLYDTMKP